LFKDTRIAFKVYGCTLNQADALSVESFLKSNGFKVVEQIDDADTVVVFSCAVRNETEDSIISETKKILNQGKKVVITSCLANSRPGRLINDLPNAVILIGGDNAEIVDALRAKQGSVLYGKTTLKPAQPTSLIYPLKISQGCTSNCYFCLTKLARPKLWCRPSSEIVNAVRSAVLSGSVEIDLTSMDSADYFDPPATRLPQLIEKIVNEVEGNYKIRVGMMNPQGALKLFFDLKRALMFKKVFKFLHIPIQSGDINVVKDMNRNYDPLVVVQKIIELKQEIPNLMVATDIMVGYPTETQEAFEKSLKLIESGVFDKIHMFRFTPRPHTKAALLKQLDENLKKKRSEIASQVIKKVQLEKHSFYAGKELSVLITNRIPNVRLEGRLDNYLKVYLPDRPALLGKEVIVRIDDYTPEHLIGRFL
jgi:MiaB-like tRNA modifying enzyme